MFSRFKHNVKLAMKSTILLAFSAIIFTSCSTSASNIFSEDSLNSTNETEYDKYGQICYDGDTDVLAETLPAYIKYGDKHIKLKKVLSYYTKMDYTYTPYVILIFDRSNLSDKDIHFLSDRNEDNLTPNVYISTDPDTDLDDCIEMSWLGWGYYDKKEWRMYYECSEEFRNKPTTLFSDICLHVNDPESDKIYSNNCSLFNYELNCLSDKKMTPKINKELNSELLEKLDVYSSLSGN